ncbi:energy transducer TonB [Anaeromyxobacter dehalogenans]|uniref:energy transducer TonB n=1 Tax=Anaeromyxobacter dehalogenans TaxID=161493 RepID=UPI0002ECA19F|nr:energy transducer TonB [Anaeromyxobacter dehalogenans]
MPRVLPEALPAAGLEPVTLEAEEVLTLGEGQAFTGDGVGDGPFVPGDGFGPGGGGAGGEAGDGGEEGPPWLRSAVLRQLQAQIDRDPYPAAAELMGWSGTVRVGFTILTDGSVADVRVLASSGHGVLDRAALAAVRKAAPYPRPPVDQPVVVPVVWYLPP